MIQAYLYEPIYLVFVTIITIIVTSQYGSVGYEARKDNSLIAWFLAVLMTLFIGFRPVSGTYFVDMKNYFYQYEIREGNAFYFTWNTDNFLFDNLFNLFVSIPIPFELFILLIAAIYFMCIYHASKKMFPNDTLIAFLVYLGAFSTFSYATNGIKAGAAASLFLVALTFREKKPWAFLFLFLSLGFHHSMIVPIVAYLAAMFYKNPKTYLYFWIFCFLMAALHVTFFQGLFSSFADEQGAQYLVTDQAEKPVSGFRPDFIIYSAIPIFIGYYLMKKNHIASKEYSFIWCIYTLTNGVFLLCTYGEFINRIAYLSWLMLPFVLLFPFVNIRWSRVQEKYFKYVVYGHLAFTLFMVFIYYRV